MMFLMKFLQGRSKLLVNLVLVAAVATLLTGGLSQARSQDSALLLHLEVEIITPLGEGALRLTSLTGSEEMSRLYIFRLDMVSDNPAIDPKAMVGQRVTVNAELPTGDRRHFDGFVSRFVRGRTHPGGQTAYQAEIVPWLWFLTRTSDNRIFQNLSVPEIVREVFDELGFADYTFELRSSYIPREYTVQYRETDFNFVNRLMEEEGIFYFFEHENGRHTMVLADSAESYIQIPGRPEIAFRLGEQPPLGAITDWQRQLQFRSGKYTHTDYDFQKPSVELFTSATSGYVDDLPGIENFELYEYPGGYTDEAIGERLARIRIQSEDVLVDLATGVSDAPLIIGSVYNGTGHPQADQNRSYLVTRVGHHLVFDDEDQDFSYLNTFTSIPADVQFRPPRVTPKPVVQGPQTAFVVGPAGKEIFTDKFGRVKVQFHWDREGKGDEKSSCWIRVSQSWAGKQWGFIFLPRIGQEVIVNFLEGDPDRPIITGLVPNAETMPLHFIGEKEGKKPNP